MWKDRLLAAVELSLCPLTKPVLPSMLPVNPTERTAMTPVGSEALERAIAAPPDALCECGHPKRQHSGLEACRYWDRTAYGRCGCPRFRPVADDARQRAGEPPTPENAREAKLDEAREFLRAAKERAIEGQEYERASALREMEFAIRDGVHRMRAVERENLQLRGGPWGARFCPALGVTVEFEPRMPPGLIALISDVDAVVIDLERLPIAAPDEGVRSKRHGDPLVLP